MAVLDKFVPSAKQAKLCRDVLAPGRPLHFMVQGAQGSGKTSLAIRAWAADLATVCPPGQRHIVTYADERQGKHELGKMLREFSLETGIRTTLQAKVWYIESLLGERQTVLPISYGKGYDEAKFLNWNLASIFVDEAVNMPHHSRQNLISRLRAVPNPLAIWCYNPKDKNKFKASLYDPIADGLLAGNLYEFALVDNPGLPEGYVEMQMANYPDEADRIAMVLGKWAAREGPVYRKRFTDWSEHNPEGRVREAPVGIPPLWYIVGVDPCDVPGGGGTTAATLLACYPETLDNPMGVWQVGEYYWKQSEGYMDGLQSARAIVDDFERYSPKLWVVDQAGGDMAPDIAKMVGGEVKSSGRPALPVVESINHVKRFFNNGWLWLDPRCENTIAEGQAYHYPEDAEDKYGDLKPVKDYDHALDAMRYALWNIPTSVFSPQASLPQFTYSHGRAA